MQVEEPLVDDFPEEHVVQVAASPLEYLPALQSEQDPDFAGL